jgi:transposase-like protein
MIDLVRENTITVKGVAERYEVHPSTVYGWFKGGLEKIKVGGRVVTSLEALQRFAGDGVVRQSSVSDSTARELEALGYKIHK